MLDVQDGKALLISKYALDCKPYNTSDTYITWELCTRRHWLNNDFINFSFPVGEKEKISRVVVPADENSDYKFRIDSGNSTQDKVFLLSINEADKYFKLNEKYCKPTNFAISNGAIKSDNDNCGWWLRTPGFNEYGFAFGVEFQTCAATVESDGNINKKGVICSIEINTVRPALWVDLIS